jgi:type I restriction enzyme R subunit
MQIDGAVKSVKRDGWRGNLPKEREIKAEIFKQLAVYAVETGVDIANEPPEPFGMENKVEAIFNIIREQKEY